MPYAAWVGTNGLKAWVMVVSGELSMTSLVALVVEPGVLPLGLDEHAASPAQTTVTTDRPTRPRRPSRVLMLPPAFLVDQRSDVSSAKPVLLIPHTSLSPAVTTAAAAAASRCQHEAARSAETGWGAGSSARHWSSANGHRGLNGQPCSATAVPRPADAWKPERSVLPRLSGSGAEATSSWVYGWAGCWVTCSAGPRSTISPAYMTSTSSSAVRPSR